MVERWGFVAETAADGQEALDKLPLFQPHAIVTDVMMPGMDGMELLRRLNEIARAPPVIVLTAFGSIDAALTTVHEHGAFWFVEKPIRPRTFRLLRSRARPDASDLLSVLLCRERAGKVHRPRAEDWVAAYR